VIGIVVSREDEASAHIGEHLLDLGDFEASEDDAYRAPGFELREFEDLHIHLDDVAEAFDDPEFVVFVSRHAGDTGPLLTAHFTGNFGEAEYGGADRSLAPAATNAHRHVISALREYAPEDYDVGVECTHHGPSSVGAPSMFVELGSGEEQWADQAAARAVAKAVLGLRGVAARTDRSLVAFGGGHYAPRPTRIVQETGWAVGHIAADWGLDELGDPAEHPDVLDQMFTESTAEHAVVDGEQPDLETVVDELGYEVVSETWAREVDGVPLSLADSLEADICSVDEGLRFGTSARQYDDGYVVVDLPGELLDAAHAADPTTTLDAAQNTALAMATEENGNRLTGLAAFADETAYDSFLNRVTGVLGQVYDEVERENGTLRAEREVFDPEAAKTLGVPEGPKFGTLASGESVEVDGTEVTPAVVSQSEIMSVSVGFRERACESVRRPSDAEGKGN
jgi:D-aminoacyl-tRNA deacylase